MQKQEEEEEEEVVEASGGGGGGAQGFSLPAPPGTSDAPNPPLCLRDLGG